MQDSNKVLKHFDRSKLLDQNNPFQMQEIHDVTDDRYLELHPEAKYMSYHNSIKRKYKDLASYIRRFRCKKCQLYETMKAIPDENNQRVVIALICSNCSNIVHLDIPLDPDNVNAGIDKRPELMGKATKMKEKLTDSRKLGIDKALRKDSPQNVSEKTFLLKDSSAISSQADFSMMVRKSLRNSGMPLPTTNTTMQSVYDEDIQFNRFMQGKGLTKEKTVYNTSQLSDII